MKRLFLTLIACLLWSANVYAQSTTNTSNIHNTSGWLASHSYTYSAGPPSGHFTRVTNGAAWNGSAYTAGSALNAYQLISPTSGTCTSASSGGPSGTSSNIVDGTCTWEYLSGVDYVTLSGFIMDAPVWASGTTYAYFALVRLSTSPYNAFVLNGTWGCHSTVAPTIGTSGTLLSDGCEWTYRGDIIYTSGATFMPNQTWNSVVPITACIGATSACTSPGSNLYVTAVGGSGSFSYPPNSTGVGGPGISGRPSFASQVTGSPGGVGTYTLNSSYQVASETMYAVDISNFNLFGGASAVLWDAKLWNDQEYVTGVNNEIAPMELDYHSDYLSDGSQPIDGHSRITFEPAPGEDFGTTYRNNNTTAIAGYDANKGVAVSSGSHAYAAMCVGDSNITFQNIQWKAAGSMAIDGMGLTCPFGLNKECASCVYIGNILVATGTGNEPTILTEAIGVMMNNLIITNGNMGLGFNYPGYAVNNTIIHTGPLNGQDIGIVAGSANWVFTCGENYSGNAVYGFETPFAILTGAAPPQPSNSCVGTLSSLTLNGQGNAADNSSYTGPGGTWPLGGTLIAADVPGVTYGVSGSSAFNAYPGDYRISPASSLYGARSVFTDPHYNTNGNAVSPPSSHLNFCSFFAGDSNAQFGWLCNGFNVDALDMINNSRPQGATRYDIGALEYVSGAPAPPGSGRLLRGSNDNFLPFEMASGE